ncbi:hypothetical protein AB0M71_25700, partial [Amycolatopsis sp. NPDC051114]
RAPPGRRAGHDGRPGGTLLVESSERQAPVLSGVFTSAGLMPRVHESEELGATVVTGTANP